MRWLSAQWEGLESPFSGDVWGTIQEPLEPTVVWHVVGVDGPLPDRATARLGELTKLLRDELRDGFGKIVSGEVELEKNEFVKRLIDEFREETGIEIVRMEIEE